MRIVVHLVKILALIYLGIIVPGYIQPAWADEFESSGTTSILQESAITITYSKSNDGSFDGSWKEGILAVNGTQAFCTQIDSHFKSGIPVQQIDPKAAYGWSQDDIDALALGVHYILSGKFEYQPGKFLTKKEHTYAAAQKWVWDYLRDMGHRSNITTQEAQYNWIGVVDPSGNVNLSPPGAIMQVYAYVKAHKNEYTGSIVYWSAGAHQNLAQFSVEASTGTFEIVKSSSTTSSLSFSSLEGATYGIFSDAQASEPLHTIPIKADGTSDAITLLAGTYILKELQAPQGYDLDMQSYTVVIDGSSHTRLDVTDVPQSQLQLLKKSAASDITQNNALYTLAGAQYRVADKQGTEVGILETDSSGTSNILTLSSGTYVVSEIAAPPGFKLSSEKQEVHLEPGKVAVLEFVEEPMGAPLDILIKKFDAETKAFEAQQPATFQGAQFRIEYFDTHNQDECSTAQRTWIVETDAHGVARITDIVDGDEPYLYNNKTIAPLGLYKIEEIQAPQGYLLPTTGPIYIDITPSKNATELIFHEGEIAQDIVRGDLEFVKVDAKDMRRLAHIPFKITNKETREYHVVVSDENGFVSTSSQHNAHSFHTNANDVAQSDTYDTHAGIWFGAGEAVDERGALPFGTYTIEELPSSANEGYDLVQFEVHISRDNTVLDMGTVADKPIAPSVPHIETMAINNNGDKYVSALSDIHLVDQVSFEGLIVGETYSIRGEFICADEVSQQDYERGSYSPLATSEVQFIATESQGSIHVNFTVDASKHAGHRLVAVERLYVHNTEDTNGASEPNKPIATHEDLQDEGQSIYIKDTETPEAKKAPEKLAKTADTSARLLWISCATIVILTIALSKRTSLLKKGTR